MHEHLKPTLRVLNATCPDTWVTYKEKMGQSVQWVKCLSYKTEDLSEFGSLEPTHSWAQQLCGLSALVGTEGMEREKFLVCVCGGEQEIPFQTRWKVGTDT